MIETWKPVPIEGYSANYEISSYGNVRRLIDAPRGPARKGDKVAFRLHKGGVGHLQVSLCHNAQYIYPLVHRLVLLAFVGPCPAGMQGCHNDGDPKNNHISNLRWDTPAANTADQIRHGTRPFGSQRKGAKLTEESVKEIRKLVAQGFKQRDLARQYGVSDIVISFAVNRKTWKHVA